MTAQGFMLVLLALCAGAPLACRDESPPEIAASEAERGGPPNARWETVDLLREDAGLDRHPSDGGGRAWLAPRATTAAAATVMTPGRWSIVYEAGPLGVAEGGMIFLQVSPFWGWSMPQVTSPRSLGYTEVTAEADGVELRPHTLDQQLLAIEVQGRALAPGERVRIVYGAGPAGARADRYAERGSRFWIAVDGNGDGVRKIVADSPTVDVAPGPPARLVLTLPTTARPGQRVRLTVALLDRVGNAGVSADGEVVLQNAPPGIDLPRRIVLARGDGGHKTIEVVVREEGIYRLRATGPGGLAAQSNPLVVSRRAKRVLWADLHGHSNLSDGTGTPEDYFRYARDVAGLDIAALTDHDRWGIRFLDQSPDMWDEIRTQTRRFHQPDRFVTLLGYEWTSWIHGHRHVLYFDDDGEVLSSIDPDFESPLQLWSALRGRDALTLAHHSAGGPIATNWSIPPDPVIEPVTEIASVHGSSEAYDSPVRIYNPVPGNFVRDVLDKGYRLGFVGSGDSHDGHPGLSHLFGGKGGVAAILSETSTRDGVLEALRARRVYATNGPRILLEVALDGWPMGAAVEAANAEGTPRKVLRIRAVAPEAIERIDLIRSGAVSERVPCTGSECSVRRELSDLLRGDYIYARVISEGGGLAWSSPIFIE